MSETIKQVAERIREVRDVCGLIPEQVAQHLGLPLELYLQYENAEMDIPISALYEIAALFQIDFTELLTGIAPKLHNYCLVRHNEGVATERYPGYQFESLAYKFAHKKFEPLLVTIEPEENKKMTLVTHTGQEFNYILEGRVQVIIGNHQIEMAPGDSLYFDPTIPHGQVAADGKPAKFLTIILHD